MKNEKVKLSVMFVCTGNTCRSPMAECLFKNYLKSQKRSGDFTVSSAGLFAERGDKISAGACEALKVLNIAHNAERKARVFTVQMSMDQDVIVGMSYKHAAKCGSKNAVSFDDLIGEPIPDPYGGTVNDYLECAVKISSAFPQLLELCDERLRIKRGKENV